MRTKGYSDFSITLSTFFLKSIGLWAAGSDAEERRRKFALCYTLWVVVYAVLLQIRDFYFTWGDFTTLLYVCCNMLSVLLAFIKITVILAHKVEFTDLIVYMREHFWNAEYNDQEMEIFDNARKTCIWFIFLVTFTAHCAIVSYIVVPVMANMGKNESERVLPFNMWLNLPLSMTPYYEILFVCQILSLYHVAVCYFSFDNFLCILNVHVASQFRILQRRLTKVCDPETDMRDQNENIDLVHYSNKSYIKLKHCIEQHQKIINYCAQLETVFKMVVLGQVLIFSFLICLFGYQILQPDSSIAKRCIFIFLLSGSSFLLLMFTYSCHGLIEQSDNVGIAAYSTLWTLMPMNKAGKMLRDDLLLIILRSRRVCCLTANGFFPVSLETYTSIFSTAMSYFTLLRSSSDNAIDS